LDVYHSQTKPLVEFYSKWAATGDARAPKYRRVNGVGPLDGIREAVLAALK
jgi:adenylate kinase